MSSPRGQQKSQGSWQKDLERMVGGSLSSVKNPEGVYKTLSLYALNDDRLNMMINSGETEVAKRLVEQGVSSEALNSGLVDAAKWGLDDLVSFLVRRSGITPKALDNALNVACDKSHYNVVRLLINAGANVNNSEAPLQLAIRHNPNAIRVVNLLLDSGADLHKDDDEALDMAVREDLYDIAKLLLERGANANAASGGPMEYAIRNDDGKMILLLVKHGADWTTLLSDSVPFNLRDDVAAIIRERILAEPDYEAKRSKAIVKTPAKVSSYRSPRMEVRPKTPKRSPNKQTEESRGVSPSDRSPRSANQEKDEERPQCAAITQAGTRCTFRAKEGSIYCGKHQK